jgi:hypothetical protein
MSDLHIEQRGMQAAYSIFEFIQKLQSFAGMDVDRREIPPVRNVDETAAKNNAIFVKETAPEIWEVGGVAGLAVRHADRGELFFRKRRSGERHGQLRLGSCGELRELEGFGICREENFVRSDGAAFDVKSQRVGEIHAVDAAVVKDEDAEICAGLREAAHHFAGVDRAAGDFFADAQIAGVVPEDRRSGIFGCSIEFEDAGKIKVAVDLQISENRRESSEYIAESRKVADGGFGEGEPTGVTAGAGADAFGFEHGDGPGWGEALGVGGGREAAEATAYHCDVYVSRQLGALRREIDGPRRRTPAGGIGTVSQQSAFPFIRRSQGKSSRDAGSPLEGTAEAQMAGRSAGRANNEAWCGFDAGIESLEPCTRDFSLYSLSSIWRSHPTPLRFSTRPLYFTCAAVRVDQRDGCISIRTIPIPARAGGMQWLCNQHR